MARSLRLGFVVACVCLAAAPRARADDPPPARRVPTNTQLANAVPIAGALDGIWGASLRVSTQAIGRTYSPPYPFGSIGHWSWSLLYGLSWTAMLGLESQIVTLARGGVDWIGAANYRIDWMVGYDLPACPAPGAYGGCGVGAGDFAYLSVRPVGSRWWWEAGGGWLFQRVANDAVRTLAESMWVLTPITVLRELGTDEHRDVALKAFVGPGVYGGMHNAHVHPTNRGQELIRTPWTQMYPLDFGAGVGGRAEVRLTFWQRVSLEAEVIMAPFLVGGPAQRVSRDVAPLDFEREGVSVWRKLTAGVAWDDPKVFPFKTTLAFFGAELSDRPIERLGYRGALLRFDVPMMIPRN